MAERGAWRLFITPATQPEALEVPRSSQKFPKATYCQLICELKSRVFKNVKSLCFPFALQAHFAQHVMNTVYLHLGLFIMSL